MLTPVPAAWKTRRIDFGRGERLAMTIPWGDVVTAHHSTGIPNVEVYMAVSPALRLGARLSRPFARLLGSGPVQVYLRRRIQAGPAGPEPDPARAAAV